MTLQIFDTLARGKRPFDPREPGKIGLYVCGMTVYDRCHLGHGRVMVAFDVIVRYLRAIGYAVQYVRNITDVDDKIFARAAERGIPFTELTAEMIDAMHADERSLNCCPPDVEPRATQHIEHMLVLITLLVAKGAAYQGASGDVYFRVSAFPDYGKLNNRKLEDMVAGARVQVADDKEHPADFVLWKRAKAHEAFWESPWGPGRPGWHIECSAMSMEVLGKHFDIHGGGPDLKFPHHENEIAQSEAATGCRFANYWMHAGPVRVNDEKMSKSLGNFVTLDALFSRHDPAVIRLFLLQSHYRSAISFTEEALIQADTAYLRLL
ncbi:MAG: cysteine--tRNA ligase, partial [Gammaproteobacteria bacterium]|nr:cysteine--tRNA ligase [Gammaproteobacteria bacterium]